MNFRKYLIICALALFPICAFAAESTCQPERFCRMGPVLTSSAIIEVFEGNEFKGIVLVERATAPYGKSLPCARVCFGEKVEESVQRKAKEHFDMELYDLRQFHVYSEPNRDMRHHSVEVVHLAKVYMPPSAVLNCSYAYVVRLRDIPWKELAFDHAEILRDYLSYRHDAFSELMIKP